MSFNLDKKLLISTSLVAALIMGGCSDNGGESSTGGDGGSTPPPPSSTAQGKGVDGYIANAHLYADMDGSKTENSGDLNTTTDASGNFAFDAEVVHGTYLYLNGGTDVATHTPFTGVLSASYQGAATVVSPLSTMVVALMQNEGLSYDDAVTRAAEAMNLSKEQVLADPYAVPTDNKVFIASQRVVSAAEALGGDFTTAVTALAQSDMNVTEAAGRVGVSSAGVESVDEYLLDLERRLPLGATPEELTGFQMIIDDAVENPASVPSAEDSATVANAYNCLTFDAIKGLNLSENNITSDLNTSACDGRNPDANIVWSSDATTLMTADGTLVTPVSTGGDVNLSVTISVGSVSASKDFALTVARLDNHPPVAVADTSTTLEDTPVSFNVLSNDTDPDGDALTLVAVSGNTTFDADGTVHFTPPENLYGGVGLVYTVKDSWGAESNGSIEVTITPVDDLPVLGALPDIDVLEDFARITIPENATDPDNNVALITYTMTSLNPSVATVVNRNIYAVANAYGTAPIEVNATSNGVTVSKIFNVNVAPVDDAPVIAPISDITVAENSGVIEVNPSGTDVDNNDTDITYTYVSNDSSIVSGGNSIATVPDAYGVVTVTVTAHSNGLEATTTFDVNVTAVNSAAVIGLSNIDINLSSNTQAFGLDLTPLNESYTLSVIDSGDAGIATFTISGGDLSVTPIGRGWTTVKVRAVNSADTNLVTDKNITVHVFDPNNNAPVANNSTFSVVADDVAEVTLLVSDSDGDPMSFDFSTPAHGRIVTVDEWGHLVYAAEDGFIGEDSFTYSASDGDLTSATVTVSVHVTESPDAGQNSDDETPITLAQYNSYAALSANGINMYSVREEGWGTNSDLQLERLVIDESASVIHIYNELDGTSEEIPYTTDGNEMLIDFDNNGSTDLKLKYVGTVTKTEIELDKNITLPAGSSGYQLAILNINEEYDFWDEPEYEDFNCTGVPSGEPCVGLNPFTSLDDFVTDTRFDENNPEMHEIWIDGYNFMFAANTNLLDGNGTIIRFGRYWDGSGEHYVVTNDSAGTWALVNVDGDDVIKVTPSVYGLTTERIYHLDYNGTADNVYAGEYSGPNRASLESKYDENTTYHIANSIMNQEASLPVVHYADVSYHMLSFNSMPDIALVKDTWMHSISAYTDNGNYVINMHSLKFDSNGTLEMRDTQDGDMNATYTMSGNVATLTGMGIEAKLVEIETNATRLINELGIIDTSVFDGITPRAYRLAHLEPQAELEIWDDVVHDIYDSTSTFSDLNTFETAFLDHEVAIDETPNGNRILYYSGVRSVGGTLGVYDGIQQKFINSNAGTWSYVTVDGNVTIVFDFYVEHVNEEFNVVAQVGGNGDISRGHYKEADSGSVEYRLDDTTRNAVMTYLNDQNSSGTPQALKSDTPIKRTVTAVPFTNDNMYDASVDINTSTCDHNVTTAYIKFDGTTGVDSNGTYLISSDVNYTAPYNSYDGEVVYVAGDTMLVKVAEELNASQLMDETSLYLPSTAHGYRVIFMYSDHDGDQNVALDENTIPYFKSYLQNNALLNGSCGTPAP